MNGHAERRIDRNAWEIYVGDKKHSITFEFKIHKRESECAKSETTLIQMQDIHILKGLANALQEMGILAENGTTAELRATKYHLEDMRKLVLK